MVDTRYPKALALSPRGPLSGRVVAPASKSHTNRALVLGALAQGSSRLSGPLRADDTERMGLGLAALGVEISEDEDGWTVQGRDGRLGTGAEGVVIDAGLSGTTLRFLTAAATLGDGIATVTGQAPLLARPVGPLAAALADLGASLETVRGRPPVVVHPGGLAGGRVVVDATTSSQYVTALLLVAPYARGPVVVVPSGLGAGGYVDMTIGAMARWGVSVERDGPALVVPEGQGYQARHELIAGDASAAGHLMAMAMATGGEVRVANLGGAGDQPDLGMLGMLERMGARCEWDGNGALSLGAPLELAPLEADLATMPDQLPTLAVLAALAEGTSVLEGIGVTRHHETDRVSAVAAELAQVGVGTEVGPDRLVIHGGRPRGPARIRTYRDHRMAMAFAALGARIQGITVEDPACVAKTYPAFWDDARALGLSWAPSD